MKVIGLTGGIGAGKSTIAHELLKYDNIEVISTDDVAKEQMKKGGISYEQVKAYFGDEILDDNGEIDRQKLSAIVFADSQKKEALNAITHPNVRKYVICMIDRLKQNKDMKAVFVETALLIEAGYRDFTDEVWYIYAPHEQRMTRLMTSRGYTKEKALAIIAGQKSDEEFRKYADYIIDNSDGADISNNIDMALRERLKEH